MVGRPRATARGMAQSDPCWGRGKRESAARAHRGISPPEASQHRDGPTARPGRRTGAPPPGTLTGAHAHRHRHTPESRKPARENALPPRTGGPHVPHTRKAPRAPPRLGDATGRRRPGERHPHEARPARPQTGEGSAGRSHARDEEERPAAAGRGRQARTAGAAGQGRGRHPGTTKTPGTRPGHQENQRGVPPPPTHEGGPATRLGRRPVPASPRAGPHDPAPPPGPASRPNPSSATRPRQIRLPIQVCHPEARHPGDHALERGGPDRDRTPPPAAARGERAGAIGSPAPRLRGWGSRGRPDVAPPTPSPPLPQGSPHRGGRPRAHAAHARSGPPPPAGTPGGAQRDPPPTRRGEARAAVGNERHTAPPRGRRTRPPPPPEGRCGAGCSAHALLAAATAATAHSGGAAAGGSDTPRLPLGSLEKAFSPRARRPSPGSSLSFGPTEALHEPPVLSWGGRGLRYR